MRLLCGALHTPLCQHSTRSLSTSPHNSEFPTHAVIAELTQVIPSDEEGHQLPVILEIYRLKGCKESRTKITTLECFTLSHKSKSVTRVKLTGSDFRVSIKRCTWFGIPLYEMRRFNKYAKSLNITQCKSTNQTHATLAPDTAKLKPDSFSPFDIPLILGLNFLNISVVNQNKKRQ